MNFSPAWSGTEPEDPDANCDVYSVLFESGQSFIGVYVGVGAEYVEVGVPLLVPCVTGEFVPLVLLACQSMHIPVKCLETYYMAVCCA